VLHLHLRQGEKEDALGDINFDAFEPMDPGLEKRKQQPLETQFVDAKGSSEASPKRPLPSERCDDVWPQPPSASPETEAGIIFRDYNSWISSNPLPHVVPIGFHEFCALDVDIEGPLQLALQRSVKLEDDDDGSSLRLRRTVAGPGAPRPGRRLASARRAKVKVKGGVKVKKETDTARVLIKNEDACVGSRSLGDSRSDKEPAGLPKGYVSSFNFFVVARREAVLAENIEHQVSYLK
jgi:hypothetical protein